MSCFCGESSPDPDFFPLCKNCGQSLIPCPPLCPHCVKPNCKDSLHFSTQKEKLIHSHTASFLLIGRCYTVLKRWKTHHGPILDRIIFKSDRSLQNTLQNLQVKIIIPIPQRIQRSWLLGGSPAEKIARWISLRTGVPWMTVLSIDHTRANKNRQAELSKLQRVQNKLPFQYNLESKNIPNGDILLVDDFMTTGHTLRSAAKILKSSPIAPAIREIHAYCLGYRPALQRLTNPLKKIIHL